MASITAELPAKVSWPNQVSLSGTVELSYLAEVDPWLVHMTFKVAGVRQNIEIERTHLMQGSVDLGSPRWHGTEGAPLRIGTAGQFIRFRVTDTATKTWADFDIKRKLLIKFLARIRGACSYESEKAALSAYLEKSLGELT